MKRLLVATFVATACSAILAAKDPDPRLATVRKAFIQTGDELGDDKPVAACFAEHLSKTTPMSSVDSKDAAEVVLIIRGTKLPGNTSRKILGELGTSYLAAELPDGTKLWSDVLILRSDDSLAKQKALDIPCALADGLADKLRQGMRKARDSKK